MTTYKYFANVLGLSPGEPNLIVFVGCVPDEETTKNLFDVYSTKTFVCGTQHLPTMNSSFAKLFVTNAAAMETIEVYEHLWRVAKEGATVMIFGNPGTPFVNYAGYGFREVHPGVLSFAPYEIAIVRKDCADHFSK